MTASVPRTLSVDSGYAIPELQKILQAICVTLPAQMACAISLDYSNNVDAVVACEPPLDPQQETALVVIARACTATRSTAQLIPETSLRPLGFASALLIPLEKQGQLLGALMLLDTNPAAFTETDAERIDSWVRLVWIIFENRLLHETLAISRAIQHTASIIPENPSAQQLIEILKAVTLPAELSPFVKILTDWNGEMSRESAAAALYSVC